jgi:hypothetical protein
MALNQLEDDLLTGEARSVRSTAAIRLLEMDGYSKNDKRASTQIPQAPVVIMIGAQGQTPEQAVPWLQHRTAPALVEGESASKAKK